MLAGNPYRRSFFGDFASYGISYHCLGPNNETHYLPNYKCPGGLRVQVSFPSCWSGSTPSQPYSPWDVTYPVRAGEDNGAPCPASHPVQLMVLFYEVIYATQQFADKWYGNQQPFVLAHGDPTGYGGHGDFINGWQGNTLQQVIDQCTAGGADKASCPPIDLVSQQSQTDCKVPSQLDEPVRGLLPRLPGCNPVQPGPDPATQATCAGTPSPTIKSLTPLSSPPLSSTVTTAMQSATSQPPLCKRIESKREVYRMGDGTEYWFGDE